MIRISKATALLLLAMCHTSGAWTTTKHTSKAISGVSTVSPLSSLSSNRLRFVPSQPSLTTMFATTGEDGAPKRKRKRKKKVQVVDVEEEDVAAVEDAPKPEPAPVLELKPREDTPVQLEVKRIVVVEPEPTAVETVTSFVNAVSSMMPSKESKSMPEARSPSAAAKNDFSDPDGFGGGSLDDSLDQLLEDARMMTEDEKNSSKGGVLSDESGAGIKETIGNVLSTIVTVDFFVVCAFLVWFLAGIFCSYILKDDTVQILFNNNFETLVQPALGLLMIAAIGGNFFKEEEQEYDL
mmetsp:Transcript_13399/g.28395  ORF Transcript_13399/g.28395 Transcript_13399/m.28395 type:complete len:295 (-) Transcript_13399:75-959(-)